MDRTRWRRYVDAAVGAGAEAHAEEGSGPGQQYPPEGHDHPRTRLPWRQQRAARRTPGRDELPPAPSRALRDLRLVPAALAAWLGAAAAVRLAPAQAFLFAGVLAAAAAALLAIASRNPGRQAVNGQDGWSGARSLRSRRRSQGKGPSGPGSRSWIPGCAGFLLIPVAAAALVTCSAALSLAARSNGPLTDVVAREGTITAELIAVTDARKSEQPDRFSGEQNYLVEANIRTGTYGGERFTATGTVLVIGGSGWETVRLGDALSAAGSLTPTEAGDKAVALFFAATDPKTEPAGGWYRLTGDLRQSFGESIPGANADVRGLLPWMVLGDRSQLPADLETAMQNTGLTHLTAVSGANCAYVLGFVFLLARSLRCPRFPAAAAAVAALAGFVLLVRPDPSVLRAAVMGAIGVLAVLTGRGRTSFALLGAAVVILLAVDPWLSGSFAFVLSVLATSGLVVLGNACARWLGLWLHPAAAAALAMPIAAQAFCAPVLILLQPAMVTYSVPANVAAAPVVPIVTIVGMAGVAALVVLPAAAPAAIMVAGAGARWVAAVARFFDGLPGAVLPWPEGPAGMAMMAAFSAAAIVGLWVLARWGPRFPGLLRTALQRPPASGPASVPEPSNGLKPSTASKAPTGSNAPAGSKKSTGAGVELRPLAPIPGWVLLAAGGLLAGMTAALAGQAGAAPGPGPADWDIAACDVGQGDAFVIRSGEQAGVVIDTGPDPGAADTCLDRLGIARVDLLLLTHLHQDHTGGVAGIAEGRSIGRILYSSARETLPAEIAGTARANGISAERAAAGLAGRTGPVQWRFLWPEGGSGAHSENDSSAVLEATLGQDAGTAFTALFTGDLEQEAAAQLLRRHPELSPGRIAILKVAHHGARNGGAQIIRELRPRLALISAGRGNDYGHPHAETLEVLSGTGTAVVRTDSNGQVTVDAADGSLVITTDRGNVDQ